MALRPDIALQTQGIKLPDFAGAYESMLNNRARREAMDQNRQLHQAQMQEYQRKTAAGKAAAESAAQFQSGVAAGASDDELMAIDAAATLKLREAKAKAIKDEAEAKLKTLEVQAKNAERGVGIVSRISDNATLMAVLDEVDADKDLSQAVPQQIRQKLRAEGYTPENRQLIRQFRASVLSEKDRIDDERADAQLALAQQAEQRQQAELLMKKEKQPLEVAKLANEVATGTPDPMTGLPPAQAAQINLQRDQFNETKRHNERMEKLRGSEIYLQSQKAEMDRADRIAKEKGMSQESAKVYAIAETIVPELEQLRDAIAADPKKSVAGILSGWNTKLSRLAENAADKVGRLRSGGAVNPNEETRFMAQIARLADLKDGDGKSAVEAINNYITEANTVKAKMQPGGKSSGPKIEILDIR